MRNELEALDDALREVEPRARRLAWIRTRLEALGARQQELVDEVARHREAADREADDVSRIEEGGFVVFLQCLVEGRENRLARERAEAEKARLELENTRGLLDGVNRTTAELRTEAGELQGADEEVERLRQSKRRLLEQLGHPAAARLQGLDEERQLALDQRVELDEALAAGVLAQEAMGELHAALKEAHSLAQMDAFMNGGIFVDMSKRQKLEEAHRCSVKARTLIEDFDREVADVGKRVAVSVGQIDSDLLMDVFFDSIFSDWSVMSQIGKSLDQAKDGQARLAERHAELQRIREQVLDLLQTLREEELALLRPTG